jgi:O-antigen/teichoic acid export membrane protein
LAPAETEMKDESFIGFIKKNAAYSLAMFMERGLAFLLLPLYSYVLSPSEYGIYAVLFSFIAVAAFFYGLGIENNLLAFSSDSARDDEMMGTAFWSVAFVSIVLSCVMLLFSGPLSSVLFRDGKYAPLVSLAAGILWTDSLIRFFLYRLLGKQKTKFYFWISLFRGLAGLAANCVFLLFFDFGLTGIFLSYAISNLSILILLIAAECGTIRFVCRRADLNRLIRFGSPVMLTSLFITMLNFFDRYLLETMVSAEQAGWYSAAYRIGFVVNLVVTAFSMGALPFTLSLLKKDPGDKRVVSRLMTFSFCTFISLFVFLGLFVHDLVRMKVFGYAAINPSYWKAMVLVPPVALGYVFYGIFVNFSLLFFYSGKTGVMAGIVFLSFLANLIINWCLIPHYGPAAAAAATVIGFLFMASAGFIFSRRIFPVRYEWKKIFFVFVAALLITAMAAIREETGWRMRLVCFILFEGFGLLFLFPQILDRLVKKSDTAS